MRWLAFGRWPTEPVPYDVGTALRIDVPPGDKRLTRVAEKIRLRAYTPGRGSGVLVDPLQPQRRKAAERLAGKQS